MSWESERWLLVAIALAVFCAVLLCSCGPKTRPQRIELRDAHIDRVTRGSRGKGDEYTEVDVTLGSDRRTSFTTRDINGFTEGYTCSIDLISWPEYYGRSVRVDRASCSRDSGWPNND